MDENAKPVIHTFSGPIPVTEEYLADQEAIQEAAQKIGQALEASFDGVLKYALIMGKPGISFTRWQMFQIRWALWLGKKGWAQRIILKALEKVADMTDESFARKTPAYQLGEYYWLKTKHGWEVCRAIAYDENVAFEMMGVEGNIYTLKNVEASSHIPFPETNEYNERTPTD